MQRTKNASGWHVFHDFFRGFGLLEPVDRKDARRIFRAEIEFYGREMHTVTAQQLEDMWPDIQETRKQREAQAAESRKQAIDNLGKGPVQFPANFKVPAININELLSVQPMPRDVASKIFNLPETDEDSDA